MARLRRRKENLKPLNTTAEKRLIATLFGVQLTFMSDTSLVFNKLTIKTEVKLNMISFLIILLRILLKDGGIFISFS